MPWEPYEKWNTKDKEALAKRVDEINKTWGKEKEKRKTRKSCWYI